jgi:hypothetical protein
MPKYDWKWRAKHARCEYERMGLPVHMLLDWAYADRILHSDIPTGSTVDDVSNQRKQWYEQNIHRIQERNRKAREYNELVTRIEAMQVRRECLDDELTEEEKEEWDEQISAEIERLNDESEWN